MSLFRLKTVPLRIYLRQPVDPVADVLPLLYPLVPSCADRGESRSKGRKQTSSPDTDVYQWRFWARFHHVLFSSNNRKHNPQKKSIDDKEIKLLKRKARFIRQWSKDFSPSPMISYSKIKRVFIRSDCSSYCIGEFFNGTRIFDSILRINGTVYSTLEWQRRTSMDSFATIDRHTFPTNQVSPKHSYAFVFDVESPCTTTYDEHCRVLRFARKHRELSHPVDVEHPYAIDCPIRSACRV